MAEPKPIDPQKEIEIQVHELEERVDRLRAIYEQYFMGYEKLEPTVPRKDVDRRFVMLRKANIRNTALRFRFNVVTQKFNTYSMYWTRICRQIEEGTFKRHIQRANRRFGPGARKQDDFSIDVELGDFEVDMDDFDTSDVEAEAEAASRDNQPTTPPSPVSAGAKRAEAAGFAPMDEDVADTLPPSAPGAAHQQRVARHAVLPAGAKARVLVKKPGQAAQPGAPDGANPASAPGSGNARPRMPSFTEEAPPSIRRTPAAAEAPPSIRPRTPEGPPSTSVIRAAHPAAGHDAPRHVHRPPPGVVRPQISPNAQSARRVPAAQPSEPGPPSASRVPIRTPVVAPPTSPAPPVRVPTSTRMPVGLPSSVSRMPPAPDAGSPPAARAPGPPQSDRRLPIPPPSQRMPAAAAPTVRPPSPSVTDEGGPRSRRPPPPLPSQSGKKG